MRAISLLILFITINSSAQIMGVISHANNKKYAITKRDSQITDFIYSEVGEFSENKAFVSRGGLYAYVDTNAKVLCPFLFAEANNFNNGYAIVGDSFNLGMLNSRFQVVMPFRFKFIMHPNQGLIVAKSEQGLWGAYDTRGNIKIPFGYDLPPVIIDRQHIIVRRQGLYGLIDHRNTIIFNTSYQYISKDGMGYRSGKWLRLFEVE
jgi:hypothetical protein